MKDLRTKLRFLILGILWRIPATRAYAERRLPRHARGYEHYWKSPEGASYRASMRERQKDMDENPSIAEIRSALDQYSPKTVFEVGCGYGRTLKKLAPFYSVAGCDIAEDLLKEVPNTIPTYVLDIVHPDEATRAKLKSTYDIVFCRAVTMYFKDRPDELKRAMQTMETVAKKKVLVWEWVHVCDAMKRAYPSEKFEYHPLSLVSGE